MIDLIKFTNNVRHQCRCLFTVKKKKKKYLRIFLPDSYNDYIDQQCKNVHTDSNSSVLTTSTDNLKNLHYSLRWNNIIVKQSIRKFITQTLINRGFESFYYLNRNKKYRENSIDWKNTF